MSAPSPTDSTLPTSSGVSGASPVLALHHRGIPGSFSSTRNMFRRGHQLSGRSGSRGPMWAPRRYGNGPDADWQRDTTAFNDSRREGNLATTSSKQKSGNMRGSPHACLFVASLVASRSETQLKASVTCCFSRWGPLMDVKVFRDWQQRPYSFVQFEAESDALQALQEAQGCLIDDRPVRIEPARVNRALLVTHKDMRELTEQEITQLTYPFGDLEDLDLLSLSTNNQERGLAFVKFRYRDDAIQAYLGLRANPAWCVDWANHAERLVHPNDKTSLFVGQLNPHDITEDALYERFGCYGTLVDIHIHRTLINMRVPDTRCAYAFIRFQDADAATKALAAEDGASWLGLHISVQYREPRSQCAATRLPARCTPMRSQHPFPTTVGRFRQSIPSDSATPPNPSLPPQFIYGHLPAAGGQLYYPYAFGSHGLPLTDYHGQPLYVPPSSEGTPLYMYMPSHAAAAVASHHPIVQPHMLVSSSATDPGNDTADGGHGHQYARSVQRPPTPDSAEKPGEKKATGGLKELPLSPTPVCSPEMIVDLQRAIGRIELAPDQAPLDA